MKAMKAMKSMKAMKAMKSNRPNCPYRKGDKIQWIETVGCEPFTIQEPRTGDVLRTKWVGSWKIFVVPDRGSKRQSAGVQRLESHPVAKGNRSKRYKIFEMKKV